MVERRQSKATSNKMKDIELDLLKNAEFKEAFDEFDQVRVDRIFIPLFMNQMQNTKKSGFTQDDDGQDGNGLISISINTYHHQYQYRYKNQYLYQYQYEYEY